MNKKEALLLIGHGSRLPYSKNLLLELVEKLKLRNIYSGEIYIGLMEFNHPTIPEGLQNALKSGAKKIIVVPVFLAYGTHTIKDIPRILNLNNKNIDNKLKKIDNNDEICIHAHNHTNGHHHDHELQELNNEINIPEDVEIIYKQPFGSDDKLVDIIIERIFK